MKSHKRKKNQHFVSILGEEEREKAQNQNRYFTEIVFLDSTVKCNTSG